MEKQYRSVPFTFTLEKCWPQVVLVGYVQVKVKQSTALVKQHVRLKGRIQYTFI